MPKIYGFIHICQTNHWRNVLERLFDSIELSGLMAVTERIHCGVVHPTSNMDSNFQREKCVIRDEGSTANYERPTLLWLREKAKEEPDALFWYIHTKGLKHDPQSHTGKCVEDWTRMMTYWNIQRWQTAVLSLETADTYGCNLAMSPSRHYSGNFWWTRGVHVATLPGYIGPGYIEPEMWIAQTGTAVSPYNHTADQYHNRTPSSMYIVK